MRRDNLLVFDDYVASVAVAPPITAFTPDRLNATLAKFDQLAVMVIVDNLNTGTDGLDVWLSHSADGRNWVYGPDGIGSSRAGSGDIHLAGPLITTGPNLGSYLYGGPPLLSFVRLEVAFSGIATGGHVRLYVTQRDQGA
jgi:hypothetical protein